MSIFSNGNMKYVFRYYIMPQSIYSRILSKSYHRKYSEYFEILNNGRSLVVQIVSERGTIPTFDSTLSFFSVDRSSRN